MKKKYEYQVVFQKDFPKKGFTSIVDRGALLAHLNSLGAEGWRVVPEWSSGSVNDPEILLERVVEE